MAQILTKGLAANAVDDTKIRLTSTGALRARNAAGTADITILSTNASDQTVFPASPYVGANKILDASVIGAANGVPQLDSNAKILSTYLPATVTGGLTYKGTLDASTGSYPSSPAKGDYYVISVAGTLGGHAYSVGDWAAYDGTQWDYVDNSQQVSSVAGRKGAVTLTTDDVTEGTQKYFNNARAIGSTLTGYTAGAGTVSSSDTVLSGLQKLDGNIQANTTAIAGKQAAFTRKKESFTLASADVTNGYINASNAPLASSMILEAYGVVQIEGVDYSISGTKITFAGDLANVASGDKIYLQYSY